MRIEKDDLMSEEIAAFLDAHVEDLRSITPPESRHALDLEALRDPAVIFWSGRDATGVIACGAIKVIGGRHGEIKSMRTAAERRGEGLGAAMLEHIIASAASIGLRRLSLETGSSDHFLPARERRSMRDSASATVIHSAIISRIPTACS